MAQLLIYNASFLYMPHHSSRVLWYRWLSVCLPHVRPSVFSFLDDNWVYVNGFSQNLVCALILWRPGLGFLMDKFRQFFTVICPRSICILVSGQSLVWMSKDFQQTWSVHWYCGDLVWDCSSANFVIFFSVICPRHICILISGQSRVNVNGFSPNLECALIPGLGLLNGKFRKFWQISARIW